MAQVRKKGGSRGKKKLVRERARCALPRLRSALPNCRCRVERPSVPASDTHGYLTPLGPRGHAPIQDMRGLEQAGRALTGERIFLGERGHATPHCSLT